jgi:acetolactate synthase-1/2/3 large subunit
MVRVADYVVQFLEEKNIKHVFMITGGGAMFLNDGIARSANISPIFCHHEQACTMAAVAYSKVNNQVGVVMPTTGCGGTNTITGLLDAWQDSNKLVVISGQVNKKESTYFSDLKLRKLGAQEANLIDIVTPITKLAVAVDSPEKIKYYLEKAFYTCSTGRPGPVWVEIPLDIQGAYIDPSKLESFEIPFKTNKQINIEHILKASKRPVIIAGNGIHLADARSQFKKFIEKYKIPVVCTYLGADVLSENHASYIGRAGIKGSRAGNFAIQNSDLILSLGSSLSIPVTGYRYDTFAREAKIVAIDIDPIEHQKSTIKVDTIIKSDILDFLNFNMDLDYVCDEEWIKKCNKWKQKWPTHNKKDKNLNLYTFSKTLSDSLKDINAITISDAGLAYYAMGQSLEINNNRYITSGAQAEMGFTLPACIGAYFAQPDACITGITGDGSFQFNIQELQTISHYKLPVKIFVVNNGGYLSIKNTQDKFFNSRYFGVNPESGVSFPPLNKIAQAYNFSYVKINSLNSLKKNINKIYSTKTPIICELILSTSEQILPSSSVKQTEDGKIVSQPLENMFPFLSEEEFKNEMIIKSI